MPTYCQLVNFSSRWHNIRRRRIYRYFTHKNMELLILWQYARVIVTTPYWFSYFYILRNASINDIKGEIFRNLIEVIAFLIVCHKFSFNIISNHDSMNFIIWWNFVINFLEIFDVNSGLHFVLSLFCSKHEPISQLNTHDRLWQLNSFQKHISEIEFHLIRYARITRSNDLTVNEAHVHFPLP